MCSHCGYFHIVTFERLTGFLGTLTGFLGCGVGKENVTLQIVNIFIFKLNSLSF